MGNCIQTDQSYSIIFNFSADPDFWQQIDNFTQNETEEDYWPQNVAEPCQYTFCSTFIGGIPIFLGIASTLGILGNVMLGVALAKCPRFWDQRHPGKVELFLLAIAGVTFASILPFFALGISRRWAFEDRLCQVAHGLKFGCLFAQGLLAAGSACQSPWGLPRPLLPTLLWIMGFLCATPAALVSSTNGVCVPNGLTELHTWSLVHVVFCLVIFVLLPPTMMCLKGCGKSWHPHFNISWVFYLFWAPYGVAVFLVMLQEETSLTQACSFLEHLNSFLGFSEGWGILHCYLCPLLILGLGFYHRRTVQMGKC
ncbi:atypical chemokine receptor 1 [Python bivittatus]|uniref:Atypical chemokine receptor 1 n=1 Tax=Python bivittatus TaxID=176946 RepID=A0A9F2WCA7_PYTBI|nr:atypical chemokine receptor 1 [Python bivittatus]